MSEPAVSEDKSVSGEESFSEVLDSGVDVSEELLFSSVSPEELSESDSSDFSESSGFSFSSGFSGCFQIMFPFTLTVSG